MELVNSLTVASGFNEMTSRVRLSLCLTFWGNSLLVLPSWCFLSLNLHNQLPFGYLDLLLEELLIIASKQNLLPYFTVFLQVDGIPASFPKLDAIDTSDGFQLNTLNPPNSVSSPWTIFKIPLQILLSPAWVSPLFWLGLHDCSRGILLDYNLDFFHFHIQKLYLL